MNGPFNMLCIQRNLAFLRICMLCSALLVSGCFGGGGQTHRPIVTPEQPHTTPEQPQPHTSTGWWLPDNTRTLVQGDDPSLTAQEIPQKLVDTGDTNLSSSELFSDGFGRQYDGAYVSVLGASVINRVGFSFLTWENRTQVDVNGVSFAERRAEIVGGATVRRVVGFLDYANFGVWMQEDPSAIGGGIAACCQWSIANEVLVADHSSVKYFDLGTYTWRGAMIGVEKRDPGSTIMGDARIELQVSARAANHPSNTVDVSFTNIRNLGDGSGVADMSWRLNRVGAHGVGGFWVDDVGTRFADGDGNLVSGSGDVALTWSGPNHNNVVGLYENETHLGAFGGTRQ